MVTAISPLERPTPKSLIQPNAPVFSQPRSGHDSWRLPPEHLEQGRILIIDDEDLNIRVARKYLNSWGFKNVASSTAPTEVVSLVRQTPPDLVLLDIMMPALSGLDLLKILRAIPSTAHVPIIILTAHFEDEIKYQALELGANDFLSKPINALDLLPRVRNLLSLRIHQKWLEQTATRLEAEVQRRTLPDADESTTDRA